MLTVGWDEGRRPKSAAGRKTVAAGSGFERRRCSGGLGTRLGCTGGRGEEGGGEHMLISGGKGWKRPDFETNGDGDEQPGLRP